jgi:prepilin-type N-terminal cleavage/methylation domain-containing protein
VTGIEDRGSKIEDRNSQARPRDPRSSILDPRRAFTLLELIVVIAILGILASIFVPYVLSVREANDRARCAENLRQIKGALDAYGLANNNAYPMVRQAPGKAGFVAYTGARVPTTNPFAVDSAVEPNDVTASLWLLVRLKYATPNVFVCPSTDATPQPVGDLQAQGNFASQQHLSYSYATPFSVLPDYQLNGDRLRPEFAVMADMNPGIGDGSDVVGPDANTPVLQRSKGNSRNHKRAGQNVLFGNGIVEFKTSHYCGWGKDNIYTSLRSTPLVPPEQPDPSLNGVLSPDVGPAWWSDSYLVPAYEAD